MKLVRIYAAQIPPGSLNSSIRADYPIPGLWLRCQSMIGDKFVLQCTIAGNLMQGSTGDIRADFFITANGQYAVEDTGRDVPPPEGSVDPLIYPVMYPQKLVGVSGRMQEDTSPYARKFSVAFNHVYTATRNGATFFHVYRGPSPGGSTTQQMEADNYKWPMVSTGGSWWYYELLPAVVNDNFQQLGHGTLIAKQFR